MENLLSQSEEKNLCLNSSAIGYLQKVVKWAKFFAIMGYVAIGFFILLAIFMGIVLPTLNSGLANSTNPMGEVYTTAMSIFYIFLAILYIYPVITLHGFANKTDLALKNYEENALEEGLKKLKQHFTFVGRLTMVMIIIYIIGIFAMMIGGFIGGFLAAL
jgi:hypothetical protein